MRTDGSGRGFSSHRPTAWQFRKRPTRRPKAALRPLARTHQIAWSAARVSVGRVQLGGRPLSTFTNVLTTLTERRVVDRTGLTGEWMFDISFAPPPSSVPGPEPPSNPNGASLFTVIQEELGLKLQAARIPMPVMVVDRAERPVQD